MNPEFLRGICLGVLAGAAAEVVMLSCGDSSMKKRARHTIHAVGDAMEDAVDSISSSLH